jgi:hypothetical protein
MPPMNYAPEFEPPFTPANVVILAAEDDPEMTIIPRLEVAGADLTKIRVIETVNRGGEPDMMVLPMDLGRLEALADDETNLIVIDPISSYLDDHVNQNAEGDVRRALMKIKGVATRTGATILMIRHLTKDTKREARHRMLGSGAWRALPRAVLFAGQDPEEEDGRILCVDKLNIAKKPKALGYRMESAEHKTPGVKVAKIIWGAERDLRTADIAKSWKSPTKTKGEECEDFLTGILKPVGWVMETKRAEQLAKRERFGRDAFRDAYKNLGLISSPKTKGGPHFLKRRPDWAVIDKPEEGDDFQE